MRDEEAVRRYFGQPGFERFLKLLRQQYASSKGGVRGYVTLANVSEIERSTLDAYFGTYSPPIPGETKRYSLKKFERLLMDSRFGLTVPELLKRLYGEPVLTRHEQAERLNAEWEGIVKSAIEGAGIRDQGVLNWAQGLLEETSPGSRTLRAVFARSPGEARRCLEYGLAALNRAASGRGSRRVRLPILAAEVTGDAHALDWKNPLGRLFWWGLTAIFGQPVTGLAEENPGEPPDVYDESGSQALLIREGYRRGGVLADDLSSQVMLYAPELFGVREERILTLRQVERLSWEKLGRMRCPKVYMVENPSVFAELVDADAARRTGNPDDDGFVIVCGNGQPTTAVTKLLDVLLGNRDGAALHYAGDLDPAGLSIAQNLQLRYPPAFRAWRMGLDTYLRYARRGIPLSEAERSRLQDTRYGWDETLAPAMVDHGVKLHQELWVGELLQDLGLS